MARVRISKLMLVMPTWLASSLGRAGPEHARCQMPDRKSEKMLLVGDLEHVYHVFLFPFVSIDWE